MPKGTNATDDSAPASRRDTSNRPTGAGSGPGFDPEAGSKPDNNRQPGSGRDLPGHEKAARGELSHQLMGGKLHVYKRDNWSWSWSCPGLVDTL